MPLKLVDPRAGQSPNYRIRGTYLGVYVDKSSGTDRKRVAGARLRALEQRIERGDYPEPARPPADAPTFLSAAVAYMEAGGSPAYLDKLIDRWRETPLIAVDQVEIDAAALALYPNCTGATRNRKVYTPASAVLHSAGVTIALKRPKGAKGRQRSDFLNPADAAAVIAAAHARDPRFALLLKFLLYTGVRISEALALRWEQVALAERLAYVATSKNEDPRTLLLHRELAAELAAVAMAHGKVFPFRYGGGLKQRLVRARTEACGMRMPAWQKNAPAAARRAPRCRLSWVTFHIFRHTWATWMRRRGVDEIGLVATGNWRDVRSARRYAHAAAREEWAKVDGFPSLAPGVKSV